LSGRRLAYRPPSGRNAARSPALSTWYLTGSPLSVYRLSSSRGSNGSSE
jgi:hypothetical protein